MTPAQRLRRVERVLVRMAKAGRRTRSKWRYKINSLIHAQIRHEAIWRVESEAINTQLKEVAFAQAKNEKAIAELAESQKLTGKALRAFIGSVGKSRKRKEIS